MLPEGSKIAHKTLWQLWKEEQQDHLYPQLCQAHQHHLPHLHHSQDQQAQNQNWLSNLDHHYTPNLHREHWKLNSVYNMLQSVDQNYQGMLESINLLRASDQIQLYSPPALSSTVTFSPSPSLFHHRVKSCQMDQLLP